MSETGDQDLIAIAINQYNMGNCQESIAGLQSLIKKSPDDFLANRCLAKIYFDTSRTELAYKHLALSEGQLFRGHAKTKYNAIDAFIEHSAFAWENLGIKEIFIEGFNR